MVFMTTADPRIYSNDALLGPVSVPKIFYYDLDDRIAKIRLVLFC